MTKKKPEAIVPEVPVPEDADLVTELIRELVAVPGPPGQEDAIRALVREHVEEIGCVHTTDARGNLLIAPPGVASVPEHADIVIMAHLDEIALHRRPSRGRRAAPSRRPRRRCTPGNGAKAPSPSSLPASR